MPRRRDVLRFAAASLTLLVTKVGAGATATSNASVASRRRISVLDDYQVHTVRPVGAEHDGLFDVAGA